MAYSVASVVIVDLFANFPGIGSTAELFYALDQNQMYTWNGSAYVSFPTGAGAPRVVSSVGGSATPTVNVAVTDVYEVTALAQAVTAVTVTGTPVDGQQLTFRWHDNGVLKGIVYGASFLASGAAALLTTTVATKTHLNTFRYDSAKSLWISIFVDATGY